jgi:GAF domain-containing protein
MTNLLAPGAAWQVFGAISEALKQETVTAGFLQSAVAIIGKSLGLDRCSILLTQVDSGVTTLFVAVDYAQNNLPSLTSLSYQLHENSEVYGLLQQGKPLPLKDLVGVNTSSGKFNQLERFIEDSGSQSLIMFPMLARDRLVGCLTMHRCHSSDPFSEELLQLGEALTEVLTVVTSNKQTIEELSADRKIFDTSSLPIIVLDTHTMNVVRANRAYQDWLCTTMVIGQNIEQIFKEGHKITQAVRQLNPANSTSCLSDMVPYVEHKAKHMDVELSLVDEPTQGSVLAVFHASSANAHLQTDAGPALALVKAEEAANSLSRQLSWERWMRQIICKLHSTLDRDTLLQTVVDTFGRTLGASRCLIIRTDGQASPAVTHEYAEPDISPLGLGRTGQFPAAGIAYFRHKVAAIPDISLLEKSGELTHDEYDYFAENGVRGIVGAPISSHGTNFGMIVILAGGPVRKWSQSELDMLEIAANQTAVALANIQAYLELKDQLFNMNLLSNLTQQLTNTLELVSRTGKSEQQEDRAKQMANQPPLSLRELEVLKLIASGLANREIAQRLFLTESTVELHASRIRKKLKLKSRTALVKFACDNGLA